jgi:hypothetical protein
LKFSITKKSHQIIILAKGFKSEASLLELKREDGSDFSNEDERKAYVRKFYKKLYKKPECDFNFNEDCIENFLGDEIVNSRLVQDSKIPPEISENFERPLTIEELDTSAEQGNHSASSKDGLSNCFFKKILGIH